MARGRPSTWSVSGTAAKCSDERRTETALAVFLKTDVASMRERALPPPADGRFGALAYSARLRLGRAPGMLEPGLVGLAIEIRWLDRSQIVRDHGRILSSVGIGKRVDPRSQCRDSQKAVHVSRNIGVSWWVIPPSFVVVPVDNSLYLLDAGGGEETGGRVMRAPHESVNRQELKDLIDSMRDHELPAIKRYLQFLRYLDDPVARSLAEAPVDDEDTTEEDIAAFRKTDDDFRTGDVATQEDLEREFGV